MMSERSDQPESPEPDEPAEHVERRDAAARAGDLDRMAREARDATFGETDSAKVRVPGVLSGDLGPKGQVSAQHRELSRAQREARGEVPPGTVASGGSLLVLLPMLLIALALAAVVVLIGWLLS